MKREAKTTLTIRLPKKLKAEAEIAAAKEDRTMTSLVTHLLRGYVTGLQKR